MDRQRRGTVLMFRPGRPHEADAGRIVDVGYFLLRAYEKARLDVGVVFDVDSDAGS